MVKGTFSDCLAELSLLVQVQMNRPIDINGACHVNLGENRVRLFVRVFAIMEKKKRNRMDPAERKKNKR